MHFPPQGCQRWYRAAVSQVLWCQFREAAIPSMSPRDSLVFIIYLDVRVLMGYSELLLRAPNYLIFVWNLCLLCHPKTSPSKGSYRCSHFGGCLALESAQGPGLWSSWGPIGQWRLKASDCGSGFRQISREKLSIVFPAKRVDNCVQLYQNAFEISKTKLCTYKQ